MLFMCFFYNCTRLNTRCLWRFLFNYLPHLVSKVNPSVKFLTELVKISWCDVQSSTYLGKRKINRINRSFVISMAMVSVWSSFQKTSYNFWEWQQNYCNEMNKPLILYMGTMMPQYTKWVTGQQTPSTSWYIST
jgi:hypothetical protein